MPTVLLVNGFRFYFYSNENNEPIHIHVEKAEGNAKFWLEPIDEEYSYGFSSNERKTILTIVEEHKLDLINSWHEYFG